MYSALEGVAFEPQHAYDIELREYENGYINRDWIVNVANQGSVATCFMGDTVILILGYIEEWPGVIRVFVIPSVYVPQFAKSVVRFVKNSLARLASDFGYHRMFTESLANEQTDKWMRVLGFECEGTLKKYSANKEDYKMWARVS